MKKMKKQVIIDERTQAHASELLQQKKELFEKLEKLKKEKTSYSAIFNNELKLNNIIDRMDYITTGKSNFKALNYFKKESYLKAFESNKNTCKFLISKDNILNIINFSFIVENGVFSIAIKPLDRETFLLSVAIDTSKMKNSEIRFLNLNYNLQIPLNVEEQNFDELEKTLLLENGTNLF